MYAMTPAEYAEAVAAEVRAEMARQRKTQSDLAKALQITTATAARRLHGEVPFDVVELVVVSNWLAVSLDQLTAQPKPDAAGVA